ncbi:NUDIX hydrolase [Vibrio mytili]|uniref:DNA mismatch repair protein MutT n=1 Tax=Vibrio mytili TaxID=50718 RepID=A0A0C3HUB9_9VIBR|nr:NUDIX domain-containing protein [Vibrio mytili]KIN11816.1 DNA mismatch repair protein MutT [Vibrio mytili]
MIPVDTSFVSGVAISEIYGEKKILLMKRVKGGYWCHVAGSIEQGETGVEAIVREFYEETQIQVTNLYNAQFIDQFFEPHVNVIELIPVFVVMCPPNQKVVLNEEHTDYKWCSLEEALELAPFPNQHAVFKHVWSYFVERAIHPLYRVSIDQLNSSAFGAE